MEQLIKVNYESEQPTVSARDLHEALEATERFNNWFERNSFFMVGGEDYTTVKVLTEVTNNGGTQLRELDDYNVTVDAAKQICMVQRSLKGKQYRQYFIDLEKAWNTPEQIMARALRLADKTIDSLKKEIVVMKPKVEFFDAVANSKTALPMDKVAKVIGRIGRNKLYELLRDRKILQDNNVPYQRYIDNGCFRVIEQKYQKPDGEICVSTKTLVYQKGVEHIRRLLVNETSQNN